MPKLTTYLCDADTQVLDKSNHLTLVSNDVDIKFLTDVEADKPVITLSRNVSDAFNYCYIDITGWYYYVVSKTYSNGHYIVTLDIDERMSFHSEIENLDVIANRSYSHYNLYQIDDKIPRLSNDLVKTQPFRNGFGDPSYILAVNGG